MEEKTRTEISTADSHFSSRVSKTDNKPNVLDPEHPLLERFQKALKEHLLQQIEHLKDDIFEYETGTKKKNADREELGVQVYEAQQLVCKQQKTLENCITQLQTVTAARQETEKEIEEKKVILKEQREKVYLAEKTELELQNEIEAMNLLTHQISNWEKKVESDITVNQRIAEKTKKDHLRLAEEKRAQDMLIYKLMREIWRLESELETIDMQLRVKEKEREELAQTVAVGNTNIEALQAEYRCLVHSWNSVIVAVANRDKVMDCLNGDLRNEQEKLKSLTAETEQVKKLIRKEFHENEKFTMIKNRAEMDIKNGKTKYDAEAKKKLVIERNMSEIQAIIDQTTNDIDKINMENNAKRSALAVLTKDYDKMAQKKYKVEEEIVKTLMDQVTNDKASQNLNKRLRALQDKNRELAISLADSENKNAMLMAEIDAKKFENAEKTNYIRDMSAQQKELEQESNALQDEFHKYEKLIRKKQNELELMNNRMEKILGISKTDAVSPQEMKIQTLEKNIEDILEKIKSLQTFWLREQRNLLSVSKERQDQIHDNNLLRKQILILEQKNLKATDELEAYKSQQEHTLRNIHNLQNKITRMCDELFKKKNLKGTLDKSNDILQTDYVVRLKDAELECLAIDADIMEIEEDKVNLSNELLALNRQALEWEKKLQLAQQVKAQMRGEQSDSGELGVMKAEIHRMDVRYTQLKKAQDKLIQDLEHCVSRREVIYTVAEARHAKIKGSEEKAKINFTKKMDDIRNKIHQTENEIKELVEEGKTSDQTGEELNAKITEAENDIECSNSTIDEFLLDIDDQKTNRQITFELLVMKQKKLNMYSELTKGRTPYTIYRKEGHLIYEYNKQKEINNKLCAILELLMGDLPDFHNELSRMHNSLKLPSLVIYS